MTAPAWLDELITIVVIAGLLYLLTLLVRRVWLSTKGGLFDCALRPVGAPRWRPGLARYAGDCLEWYLVWHPWPRPSKIFVRDNCELASLRASDPSESRLGYLFSKILVLQTRDEIQDRWELALNEGSAMGMVSWLESAPPGQVGYRRRFDG